MDISFRTLPGTRQQLQLLRTSESLVGLGHPLLRGKLLASAAVRQVLDEACHPSAVTWCASRWASLEHRQGLQMFPFSLGVGAEMVLH